jgi:hypothetical protein
MQRPGDLDQERPVRDVRDDALDDRGSGAASEGVADEVVAITLIAEREEAFPGLDEP